MKLFSGPPGPARRWAAFLPLAAAGACFLYLLAATWLKWGDVVVDTFRDAWAATRLLEGQTPYRDFFYEYGFFTPYFLAALFRAFGVRLSVLVSCGIGMTAALALLLYRSARFMTGRVPATLAVITFFFVCAFSHYFYPNIFTFILPYSFATTFFLLFLAAALYLFIAAGGAAQRPFIAWWALAMALAFCARPDMAVVAWAAFLAAGLVASRGAPPRSYR